MSITNDEITQNSKLEPKKFSILCTFKQIIYALNAFLLKFQNAPMTNKLYSSKWEPQWKKYIFSINRFLNANAFCKLFIGYIIAFNKLQSQRRTKRFKKSFINVPYILIKHDHIPSEFVAHVNLFRECKNVLINLHANYTCSCMFSHDQFGWGIIIE